MPRIINFDKMTYKEQLEWFNNLDKPKPLPVKIDRDKLKPFFLQLPK